MRNNYELQMQAAARAFLGYDPAELARRFSLRLDEKALDLTVLAAPHRVRLDNGAVERLEAGRWKPAGFQISMTVYDLLTNPNGRPVLAHAWCAHTSFHAVQGGTLSGSLMISPEESARPFAGKLPALRHACALLGGTETAGSDFSAVLPAFDCLPVLLRWWEADEEFPAQLQLLWDRNTCLFLRYETTFYLSGAILRRLQECI